MDNLFIAYLCGVGVGVFGCLAVRQFIKQHKEDKESGLYRWVWAKLKRRTW